jgi:hypothetical protein
LSEALDVVNHDVNQVGIDSSNNAYVAGAMTGSSWESAFIGGSYQPFTQFASGLGDTESLAIVRSSGPAISAPEFPLGGLAAVAIPLAALLLYNLARPRSRPVP